ncbi:hypothetical protein [Cupriavidus oxalaticus]|uniref:hypothetical protein n=1 Tax=Cupriavidus oxalaticus TaxID=96344 RepID=UPI0040335F27
MGIIESVQQYDLNIPAGGAQAIDVAGDRVQFLSAVDPFAQIEIRPNYAQGNISLKPGQGFRFGQQVTRWVVFNRGAVPLSGYLLIGSGDFFDQRIAGTVDVIDGGKARTLGGLAFSAYSSASAVAATYTHLQLWNPVGSAKNLVVESTACSCGGAWGFQLRLHSAAISSLIGNGASKLSGAAASVAELRQQTNAAILGGAPLIGLDVTGGTPFIYKPVEPIVIKPGYGLMIVSTPQNTPFAGTFEWYEDAAS